MSNITVENKLRPCYVDGKKALFHCWSQISKIRDAILVGSVAGIISGTLGIVEFENGTVESCLPENIQFADGEFREYIFR